MDVYPLTDQNRVSLVKRVVNLLGKGGVAALPTDTVYGLVADAENESAVKKVFSIKGREAVKALPVFVRDLEVARHYARFDPELVPFLEKIWPGSMTIVLRKKPLMLPDIISGGAKTVGLRIPAHPFLTAVLREFSRPLTATSANFSGEESAGSGEEVRRTFRGRVPRPDLLIDAGVLPLSSSSTVLDMTSPANPRILRMGAVSKEKLDDFFNLFARK